jgi:S-DNA-T family DNA segregation ATPase FtsK/SpoIIIE
LRFVVTLRDGRAAGTETEALIDADPETAVRTLVPHLLAALDDDTDPALADRVPVWVDGVPAATGRHTLRAAGMRPGSVVELHAREEQPALPPSGVAELRVVNGPGAGRVHRLGLGQTVVGHDAPGLTLPDQALGADALTLIARPGGQVEIVPSPATRARLDGQEVTGRTAWPLGAYLVLGETVLELVPVAEPDADTRPDAEGLGADIVRHARSTPYRPAPRFVLPARPAASRGGQNREHRRLLAQWQAERAEAHTEVVAALTREKKERREATPDPAEVLVTALGPGRRLWERRPLDDDWLRLRIGLAAQSPRSVIDDQDSGAPLRSGAITGAIPIGRRADQPQPLPTLLEDVPVTLNLQAAGIIGVVGHAPTAQAVARWLLAQCAAFHGPRELRIAVLTGHDYAARRRWEWVSRLPHTRPDEASGVSALIGNDRESIANRLDELNDLIAERSQPRRPGGQPIASSPEVVVVLDGVARLSTMAGVPAVLQAGPEAGILVICIDTAADQLPSQCRAVVTCQPGRLAFRRAESSVLEDIRPDLVEQAWADRLSRALAPLRLAGRQPGLAARGAPAGDPRAWPILWDDVGYPAPTR